MSPVLSISHYLIVGLWLVLIAYWIVAALFVKRAVDRIRRRRGIMGRVVLAVTIIVATWLAVRSPDVRAIEYAIFWNTPMAVTGAAVVTLGAMLAFWARAVIGRNWGAPATRKTETDLVTAGPYRFIRHPIYSGLLLMMVGTAIGLTPVWWLVALVTTVYFIRSARAEEQFMTERFPGDYPAYRLRTKMLVPFLF